MNSMTEFISSSIEKSLINERNVKPLVAPKIKICGNHRDEDLDVLVPLLNRIDYVGFIFTPQSKRMVSPDQVAVWLNKYPDLKEKAVAVFLDQTEKEILRIRKMTGISRIQLHGEETPAFCRQLKKGVPVEIWKVISIEQGIERKSISPGSRDQHCFFEIEPYFNVIDGILLDTKVKGRSGGTGRRFDWSVIPVIREKMKATSLPLMIAGGITANNVSELVDSYSIDGVDVASGVETGLSKDEQKIKALLKGVHHHVEIGREN